MKHVGPSSRRSSSAGVLLARALGGAEAAVWASLSRSFSPWSAVFYAQWPTMAGHFFDPLAIVFAARMASGRARTKSMLLWGERPGVGPPVPLEPHQPQPVLRLPGLVRAEGGCPHFFSSGDSSQPRWSSGLPSVHRSLYRDPPRSRAARGRHRESARGSAMVLSGRLVLTASAFLQIAIAGFLAGMA
jgi:hypothetical protein